MAVFTFIGATLFGAGTFLAGVTAFVLKTVAGVALNLLAQAIAGKPKKPTFSIQTDLRAGGDVPRSFIVGRYATAGSRVWFNTWGNLGKTPNAYFTDVIALSDMPCRALAGVWVDNVKVTLADTPHSSRGFPVMEYRKSGVDHMWIKFYDGTQTAADSFLTGTVANTEFPWEPTRVGYGITYAIVTCLINEELFRDVPQYRFELDGMPLYDPTQDSSVGGDGDQRWSDPETWGGDGDFYPVTQIYNLTRGIRFNGDWLYGLQKVGGYRVPVADWMPQIEKCRAEVDIPDDGTEPQFRSGMEIIVSAPIADAIEELLTACSGHMVYDGVQYRMICGEPDEPVAAITDDDVLLTTEDTFDLFRGLADTINGVSATFPDPEAAWEQTDLPTLLRSDFEAVDGSRRLLTDYQFNSVTSPWQCQRLMIAALEEARRERRHTLTLGPAFYALRPGQTLEYSSDENGYIDKLFRVVGRSRQPNLDFLFDLMEVEPGDYTPPDAGDYVPLEPVQVGVSRPPAQPIVDWAVSPVSQTNPLGHVVPGVLLQWDADQVDVNRVIYEIRLLGATDPFHTGTVEPINRGSTIITSPLMPSTEYEIRARYDSNSGREFAWSSWLPVTTPAARYVAADIGDGAITKPKFGADAAALIDKELFSIVGMVNEFLTREENVTRLTTATNGNRAEIYRVETVQAGVNAAQATVNAGLTTAVGANTAAIATNQTAITNETTARVNADNVLTTAVGANTSAISTEATARVNGDNALANLITDLNTEFNGTFANARMRFSAITGISGVAVRIAAEARVGSTGTTGETTWNSAGWAVDMISDGGGGYVGRFTITADYLFLVNGNGDTIMEYDAVNERLNIANTVITASALRNGDGSFLINLDDGYILIQGP